MSKHEIRSRRRLRELTETLVNLVLPGGGIILAGGVREGLVLGGLFCAAANGAVCANWLFPDDVIAPLRTISAVLAVTAYVLPQIRLPFAQRGARRLRHHQRRTAALRAAAEHLAAGVPEPALAALEAVRHDADHDLLVAVRFAQAHTQMGDIEEAAAAWINVRRLDRHKLYRDQVARHLHVLEAELARAAQ